MFQKVLKERKVRVKEVEDECESLQRRLDETKKNFIFRDKSIDKDTRNFSQKVELNTK